jgi:hypothetical protein
MLPPCGDGFIQRVGRHAALTCLNDGQTAGPSLVEAISVVALMQAHTNFAPTASVVHRLHGSLRHYQSHLRLSIAFCPEVESAKPTHRISALAALAVSPTRRPLGLSLRFQPHHFQALEVAAFLLTLWRHLRGHLIRSSAQREHPHRQRPRACSTPPIDQAPE